MKVRLIERVGRFCVILGEEDRIASGHLKLKIKAYWCGNKDGDACSFENCTYLYRITRLLHMDRLEYVRGLCEGYMLAHDDHHGEVACAGGITHISKLEITE